MRRLAAIVALLLLPFTGMTATFYVSPTGSDSNPGSEVSPWGSLNFSVNSLNAGDTLLIRGGQYSGITNTAYIEPANNSGKSSPSLTTTIKAYPGEVPFFDYNGNQPLTAQYRYSIMFLDGVTNWVVSGLVFSNVLSAMQVYSSDSNTFSGLTITKMADWMNGYAAMNIGRDSKYNRFVFNTVTNWGHFTVDPIDDPKVAKGTGLYIGYGVGDERSYYNLVESNYFSGGLHDLLQVDAKYNVMRWNTFKNAPWYPTNGPNWQAWTAGGTAQQNLYGFYSARHVKPGDGDFNWTNDFQTDQRQVWEHNTHIYTGPPADQTRAAVFYEIAGHFMLVRLNTMFGSVGSAVYFSNSGGDGRSRSNCVYGNTIFKGALGKPHGFTEMDGYFARDFTFQSTYQTNNYIFNNIAFGNYKGVYLEGGAEESLQIWRSNLFNIDPNFYRTNVGTIDTVEGFLACAATNAQPDLRINTNSPAVDAGAWLAVCTNTGSGTTLPLSTTLPFSDGNRIVEGDRIQLQWSTNTATVLSNDWENAVLHLDSSLSWTNGQGVSLPYLGFAPDIGYFESDGIGTEPAPETVATPAIIPAGQVFTNSISVSISCSTSGAEIRFTLDGSTPSSGSTLYTSALTVTNSLVLKSRGFKAGMTDSATATAEFDLYDDPGPTPPSGTGNIQSLRATQIILR